MPDVIQGERLFCGNTPLKPYRYGRGGPGKPRVADPAKGRDREGYNLYMRDYMRRQREGRTGTKGRHEKSRAEIAAQAAYDPVRDGPSHHESLTAALMGDPPVGRRAIDKIP